MAQGMRKAPQGVTAAVLRNTSFWYTTGPITFTAANQVVTPVIQIQADAHFVCVMGMYDTDTGTAATFGGGLIQIQDIAGQRLLSNVGLPFDSIFGTGQRPYVWPFTHLFRANGGISLTITNLVTAGGGAQVARFVFGGYKVPVGSINLTG